MYVLLLSAVLLFISLTAFWVGRGRAMQLSRVTRLHSLPYYHGQLISLLTLLPGLIILVVWSVLEPSIAIHYVLNHFPVSMLDEIEVNLFVSEIRNLAAGHSGHNDSLLIAAAQHYSAVRDASFNVMAVFALGSSFISLLFFCFRIKPGNKARNSVEYILEIFMIFCTTLAVLTTVGIVASLLWESLRFFTYMPLTRFLFGLEWNPQLAEQAGDQVNTSGEVFGAVPLFVGTLLIAGIAMIVAVPTGLLTAIYTAEYAAPGFRAIVKPVLEILAGIPTVIYGFFAALTVAPILREVGAMFGISISSESALAAGTVMGIMIIPFISSLSDDVISAVPQSLREGSLGLGATRSETIRYVILPAALPGIVSGVLLATSRAIGETMIVVMAAGLSAKLSVNPFEAVTTVTVQIVTLLIGDQEFDNPKTLVAFALGLVLFLVTLILNIVALQIVHKYREQYE